MIGSLEKKTGIAKHLQLRNILIELIANEYSCGDRFYSERELMSMYKVSSLTVSQAMKSLVTNGIVERRVGGGTFVKKSGDEVLLMSENKASFILYVNISPRHNIASIDPLNWFITSEIQRGIVNSFSGRIKMLSTPDIVSEMNASCNNGCILINPKPSEVKILNGLTDNLIVIDVDSQLSPAPNCIKWECMSGVYELMSYLVQECGHQKIAIIAGDSEIHKSRVAGFRIGCETLNTYCPPEYIKLVSSGTREAGTEAMRELLDSEANRPTAVFVDTDIKAEGAIIAAEEAGLQVPEDISIAGFDDIPDAKYYRPALTTVKVPYYDMGVRAVQSLMTSPRTEKNVTMKTELVVRESTAHVKK
jgi:DNA-binding transcriptional regulator YhcF (GntR family)